MPLEVIPLPTKIITPDDRLLKIIATYAGPYLQPGDTLALAESVVAITQGRLIRPEQIKPSPWALALARFAISPLHQRDMILRNQYVLPVNREVAPPVRSSSVVAAMVEGRQQ